MTQINQFCQIKKILQRQHPQTMGIFLQFQTQQPLPSNLWALETNKIAFFDDTKTKQNSQKKQRLVLLRYQNEA